MITDSEYGLALIENEIDGRACAQLIAEEFASFNSLSLFNRSTSQSLFDDWLYPLLLEVIDQRLSFFVRHLPTNEIIAALIASDLFLLCDKHPYDSHVDPSSNSLTDLFDEMRHQFVCQQFGPTLKINMVVAISAGATRSSYANKGIASRLRTHLCRYAHEQRAYEYAFVQTVHPATRHIYLNKFKGKEINKIDPANWIWKKKGDGERPLSDYRGEPITNILIQFN